MEKERAVQYIHQRSKDYLTPDRSRKGFICPNCGSGSGPNGTGITTKDGIHFTCWAGCFTNADIIDIIGIERGITDYAGKLRAAAAAFGITVEGGRITAEEAFKPLDGEGQKRAKSGQVTQSTIHNNTYTTQPEEEPDYTDFFAEAAKHIGETGYRRGLSDSTLRHFNIGYAASWRHPKAPKMEPSPRLIIPTSPHSYLARYAGAGSFTNYRGQEENKSKVGRAHIFNSQALERAVTPIFIVEGEIDAMSICEVGVEAVGMGSMSYVNLLLSELEKHRPRHPLIIALDNETEPETKARVEANVAKLSEGLRELGIPFYRKDIAAPFKDANEALVKDREGFRQRVARAVAETEEAEAIAEEEEREALRREAVAYTLPDFLRDIEQSKRAAFIPTGFPDLDNHLDGGLYAGLYIVGAISSLGKTTFVLQIADQAAAAGHDVLFFSLEMARNELIAKSISRETFKAVKREGGDTANAKTTRGILTGTRYASYSREERELIARATAKYAEYAQNIYITEGVGDVGITKIRERVEKHIRLTGKAPVVVIDYLQIIAPADMRATDKQNTDKAVLELKRMSRDFRIPIIGISSFNRENYTAPVNMASFKESGAIEYSSDVLIGLQFSGMDYQDGETDKAREKRVRYLRRFMEEKGREGEAQSIQVKVLKNRNGGKGSAYLSFFPRFNYFTTFGQEGSEDTGESWSRSEGSYRKRKPEEGPAFTEPDEEAQRDSNPFEEGSL